MMGGQRPEIVTRDSKSPSGWHSLRAVTSLVPERVRAGCGLWTEPWPVAVGKGIQPLLPQPIRSNKHPDLTLCLSSRLLMVPPKAQTQLAAGRKENMVATSHRVRLPGAQSKVECGSGGKRGVPSTHTRENIAGLEAMG